MARPRLSSLILGATLVANLVLGVVALLPQETRRPVLQFANSITRQLTPASDSNAIPAPPRDAISAAAPDEVADRARRIATDRDARLLVSTMRGAGFPAEIVRSVAGARIIADYAVRFQALSNSDPVPYWFGDAEVSDAARSAEWRALKQQMNADLASALGGDFQPESDGTPLATLQYRAGFLSDNTLQRLANPANGYALLDANRTAYMTAQEERGAFQDEVQANAKNKAERRKALENILTPDELAEYDYRISSEAAVLRRRLAAFNPTEAEYRALFDIQEATTRKNLPLAQVQEAQKDAAVQAQILKALGPERYDDYITSAEPDYANASWLTARLGLPSAAAGQVVAIKREIQGKAQQMGGSLTPEQTTELSGELQQRIGTVLGPSGARAYIAAPATGGWLRAQGMKDPEVAAPRGMAAR